MCILYRYIVLLRRSAPEFERVSAVSIITPAYSSGFHRVHCCIIIYYNKYNDGWCVRRNSTDVKKYYHQCQTKWKGSSLRMLNERIWRLHRCMYLIIYNIFVYGLKWFLRVLRANSMIFWFFIVYGLLDLQYTSIQLIFLFYHFCGTMRGFLLPFRSAGFGIIRKSFYSFYTIIYYIL